MKVNVIGGKMEQEEINTYVGYIQNKFPEKEIATIDGLELETFVHGALCYSYSGICQFSSFANGRSANRGKCLYPCRSEFLRDGKFEHCFSMKDFALEEDILKLPVYSLKIETDG